MHACIDYFILANYPLLTCNKYDKPREYGEQSTTHRSIAQQDTAQSHQHGIAQPSKAQHSTPDGKTPLDAHKQQNKSSKAKTNEEQKRLIDPAKVVPTPKPAKSSPSPEESHPPLPPATFTAPNTDTVVVIASPSPDENGSSDEEVHEPGQSLSLLMSH